MLVQTIPPGTAIATKAYLSLRLQNNLFIPIPIDKLTLAAGSHDLSLNQLTTVCAVYNHSLYSPLVYYSQAPFDPYISIVVPQQTQKSAELSPALSAAL
jgi:hypothetical protein